MNLILRIALTLLGALFLFMGTTFLIDPSGQGADFGLSPIGNQGLSSIRADFTAFFWVSGFSLLIGVWKGRGDLLLVGAALMGITVSGRAMSLALDGTYEGWYQPMAVEALTVVLALAAYKALAEKAA